MDGEEGCKEGQCASDSGLCLMGLLIAYTEVQQARQESTGLILLAPLPPRLNRQHTRRWPQLHNKSEVVVHWFCTSVRHSQKKFKDTLAACAGEGKKSQSCWGKHEQEAGGEEELF